MNKIQTMDEVFNSQNPLSDEAEKLLSSKIGDSNFQRELLENLTKAVRLVSTKKFASNLMNGFRSLLARYDTYDHTPIPAVNIINEDPEVTGWYDLSGEITLNAANTLSLNTFLNAYVINYVENEGNLSIKDIQKIYLMSVYGLSVHELGHHVYTDMTMFDNFTAERFSKNKLLRESAKKDYRKVIQKVEEEYDKKGEYGEFAQRWKRFVQNIFNILEDGFIESALLLEFPSLYVEGLKVLRQTHFQDMQTVQQLQEAVSIGMTSQLRALMNLMLSYGKFGVLKRDNDKELQLPIVDEFKKFLPLLNKGLDDFNSQSRNKTFMEIVLELTPHFFDELDLIEEMKEQAQNGDSGDSQGDLEQTSTDDMDGLTGGNDMSESRVKESPSKPNSQQQQNKDLSDQSNRRQKPQSKRENISQSDQQQQSDAGEQAQQEIQEQSSSGSNQEDQKNETSSGDEKEESTSSNSQQETDEQVDGEDEQDEQGSGSSHSNDESQDSETEANDDSGASEETDSQENKSEENESDGSAEHSEADEQADGEDTSEETTGDQTNDSDEAVDSDGTETDNNKNKEETNDSDTADDNEEDGNEDSDTNETQADDDANSQSDSEEGQTDDSNTNEAEQFESNTEDEAGQGEEQADRGFDDELVDVGAGGYDEEDNPLLESPDLTELDFDDTLTALDRAVNKENKEIKEATNERGRVENRDIERENFSNNHDNVEPVIIDIEASANPDARVQYNELIKELGNTLKRTKRVIERFMGEQRSIKKHNQTYGQRIDRNGFARIGKGYFSRENTPDKLNELAIGLLIDQSGSMSGSRIHFASLAAIILTELSLEMQLPITVFGHSTGGNSYHNEIVRLDNYLEFDETNRYAKEKLLQIGSGGANRDGYALDFMAKKLAKRPEERKLLFVISDGQPSASSYGVKEMIDDVEKVRREHRDLTIIAAAIGDDKHRIHEIYGDSFIGIDDLTTLPKELSSILKKAAFGF